MEINKNSEMKRRYNIYIFDNISRYDEEDKGICESLSFNEFCEIYKCD